MAAVSSLQPSHVSPLLSVFLHHPLSLNWPLNPRVFAAQTAWSSPALPHPHCRTLITHMQCRQTTPDEFCHGFASSQGFACHSTRERRPIILHSRLGRTIKAQAQKQTLDGQMLSQDLLLLTQRPDYYTMSTSFWKLLLSGIRSSPAFNTTCFQLSHLHGGDVLPSVSSCQVENGSACRDILEGLWDFDPLSGRAGAKEKPPKGKRRKCAWYGMMDALTYPQIAHEPFESPQNLQRCEETTLGFSTTSNSLVRVGRPMGTKGPSIQRMRCHCPSYTHST